ncbi:XRE family transcriptional regulator [Alkalispirochaeta sphaeroplastigenens]|uniref:LexA repressor n=1 Tax=Alkalispirochaeta sphaeroplastigenens TaxID=1187066 RepID=A0A2S4JRZ2_9SPIO|nr:MULTISPECIES: transcriptional repressor LexA [Alkalispirochaeta]POR02262.1 XRE family transcriptional regulator [Alkalispirochaeta sphaeroplastigenens]
MRSITPRQQEVLEAIQDFIREKKYPPAIRDLSEHFGISVKAAHGHVKALERKSMIRCNGNRSRAIEILHHQDARDEPALRKVPLLGTVVAGTPVLAEENCEGTVDVPESLLREREYFALEVRGDSMTGAGILEGDIAIIASTPVAENGQIVVALVDEAVTLKRFYREQSRVHLKAENPAYSSIYTREVRILGTLAHLLRSYG